jgi:hypothetical protein
MASVFNNETDSFLYMEIESILFQSFPMIDFVLLTHLRKFFHLFPQAFYNMKNNTLNAKMNLQKLLMDTTPPLQINCLRRTDMLRVIFEAAALLLIQRFPEYKPLMWTDSQQLKDKYGYFPEFKGVNNDEIKKLIDFRNLVVAAKIVIHPKLEYYVDLAVCLSTIN